MGLDESHTEGRNYTRRKFITAGVSTSAALYLAACGGSSSGSSSSSSSTAASNGPVTLNNLFQQQAGYSASDLAGMTKAFEKAHPNIKVKTRWSPTRRCTTRSSRRRPPERTTWCSAT